MSTYAVIIKCVLDDNKPQDETTIVLDTVTDTNITATSELTQYPIVSGDYISDHMYTKPITMTVRGKISEENKLFIMQNNKNLDKIQDFFEIIKNGGVLCTLTRVKYQNDNSKIKFKSRNSMALNSITWTEGINILDFTFIFTQVLTAEVKSYVADIDDEFLPNVTEPNKASFMETFLDVNVIKQKVYDYLNSNGFFWHKAGESTQAVAGTLVGAGIGATIGAIAFGPLGAVIGGGIGLVIGIVNFAKKTKKKIEATEKKKKEFEQDVEKIISVDEFNAFDSELGKQLELINANSNVYNIAENVAQEMMIAIDHNYYSFKFTKNNASQLWELKVYDELSNEQTSVFSAPNLNFAKLDVFDCSSNVAMFRSKGVGTYVYLLKMDESKSDNLTNYYVFTTKLKMENFNKIIDELIANTFKWD